MYDPFLPLDDISTAEALELIINYQYLEPIYHSDGFGHVQIEEQLQATSYSISNLIHFIEIKQQWSALIKLLPNKSECWLLNFSLELQKESSKDVLYCLVKLTDLIKIPDNKIIHLQYAAQWPWSIGTTLLLNETIKMLTKIERNLLKENELTSEINLSIIRNTLREVELTKVNFEAKNC